MSFMMFLLGITFTIASINIDGQEVKGLVLLVIANIWFVGALIYRKLENKE